MRRILLLALALAACTTDVPDAPSTATTAPATTGGTVEQRIIATGSNAAAEPEAPQAVAIKTADDYRGKWEQTIGGGQPPAIDFARESVVILLGGQRRTGGWRVAPRGVSLEGRTLVVDATVEGPPSDAIVTQALTSPYAVIAVSTKDFDDVRWKP
jgi:PrcB C-terminal